MADSTEKSKTERSANNRSKATRGRHADRTAAMRKRLIEAAIKCLEQRGFAATTLQAVTDEASVSRGAMLHHFPTRVDLLIAVAEFAAEDQNRHVRHELKVTEPGMDRFMAITNATWVAIKRPPAIALLEVMMGSRSDPELSKRLPPVIAGFEESQRKAVWEQAQSVGIEDKKAVESMVILHVAAMRGLVLDLVFSGNVAKVSDAMSLLENYKRHFTGQLLVAPFT